MYLDSGIVYEISKFVNATDYLNIRYVWKIPGEHIKQDTLSCAIWLLKKGFRSHKIVLKYSNILSVAMLDAEYAYLYACNIGCSCVEVEPIISGDACYSYWYARDIIKGRWSPGEKAIENNKICSYLYDRFLYGPAKGRETLKKYISAGVLL
jgi:hypothetical protein